MSVGNEPKFPECLECRFFIRRRKSQNPVCLECGCGEFFEPRARNSEPSDDELMNLYRKTYHE